MVFIVDIIGDIVGRVSAKWGGEVFYLHGHPLEIVHVLQQRTKHPVNKHRKWPLIALLQDFSEDKGDNMGIECEVNLSLIVATATKSEYSSVQRYDMNFKPILAPLYDMFINELIGYGAFADLSPGLVPHTKIDRLYWGRQGLYGYTDNIFSDRIDAIEIENLNLKLKNNFKIC